jgi:hypothetical protein
MLRADDPEVSDVALDQGRAVDRSEVGAAADEARRDGPDLDRAGFESPDRDLLIGEPSDLRGLPVGLNDVDFDIGPGAITRVGFGPRLLQDRDPVRTNAQLTRERSNLEGELSQASSEGHQ